MTSADWIDAIIILVYFVGIAGLGIWVGRKGKSLEDYALGGRNIPWWAVLASIIAAETSAATFLGTPAEGFKERGFVYAQLVIGTIIARFIIAYILIKPYYDYKVQSVYELLTIRFGTWTKNMASGIFLISRVLGIGVRLYLGGVIFAVIWRYFFHEDPQLVHYFIGILFVTFLTTLYTAIGGIKAVVYTDLIQAILMFGSAIFAVFILFYSIPGGWATISDQLNDFKDVRFIEWGFQPGDSFAFAFKSVLETPYTIFAAVIASTFFTMATHGTDQDMVQRMLTAKDHHQSRRSLILSGLADLPIVFLFLTIGILLWVFYETNPDAYLPQAPNEIFAYYIVHEMPVVLRGLIIAGVFATMMGSTSAALNALATSFTKDFYIPYFQSDNNEKQTVRAARWSTFIFGALMVIVATASAYFVMHNPSLTIIPIALGVLGYCYGSLLGVFLLAILTKDRGHDKWNVVSMLFGMLAVLILGKINLTIGSLSINFGKLVPDSWPVVSWPWYVLIGCTFTIALAIWPKKSH